MKEQIIQHSYRFGESSRLIAKKISKSYFVTKERKELFYRSAQWKKLRQFVMEFYPKKCACCSAVTDLQVDHIEPLSISPWLCLDFFNLQILCVDCNMLKSNLSFVCFLNSRVTREEIPKKIRKLRYQWVVFFHERKPLAYTLRSRWAIKSRKVFRSSGINKPIVEKKSSSPKVILIKKKDREKKNSLLSNLNVV